MVNLSLAFEHSFFRKLSNAILIMNSAVNAPNIVAPTGVRRVRVFFVPVAAR